MILVGKPYRDYPAWRLESCFSINFLKPQKKSFLLENSSSSVAARQEIKKSADENLQIILKSTGNPDDLILHRIEDDTNTFAVVIYLETLADSNLLGQHVIEPMNKFIREEYRGDHSKSAEINPVSRQTC